MGEGVGAEGTAHEEEATVGNEGTPHEDVGTVGNEGTPHEDVETPDEDADEHDGDAHEQRDVGAEMLGVDDKIKSCPAAAEILEARLAPLGLCGTTLATCPSVIFSVDALPSPPMLSLSASNLL